MIQLSRWFSQEWSEGLNEVEEAKRKKEGAKGKEEHQAVEEQEERLYTIRVRENGPDLYGRTRSLTRIIDCG